MPLTRTIKRCIPRLLLLSGSLIVALLLAEGIAYLVYSKNVASTALSDSDNFDYGDQGGMKRHIPNKIGYEIAWNYQGKAKVRINSLGFRGPEVASPKPKSTYRILFLGDSITFGGRAHEEDIFVTKTGQYLDQIDPRTIEPVNAGMTDIGFTEEEHILRETGLSVRPDLVVFCWYLNDNRPPQGFPEERIYNDPALQWFHHRTLIRRSYLAGMIYARYLRHLQEKALDRLAYTDLRNVWIPTYNEEKWKTDPDTFKKLVDQARFDWGDPWIDEGMQQTLVSIDRLRKISAEGGADFAVVALPVHAQIYTEFENEFVLYPQTAMQEWCHRQDIPFMSLASVFRNLKHLEILYDQCHYTPTGNIIAAKAIALFINDSFLKNEVNSIESWK